MRSAPAPARWNIEPVSRRLLLTRCVDLGWGGDAVFGGVAVEVVEGGELMRGGLDGVSGLVQQAADVADVAADVFGPGLVEGGDGSLGQAVAVVQDGGSELGGEGDLGAAAGAGGDLARAVAAAPVQGGLAEGGGRSGQGGGQGVEGGAGQAGDRRVGQPGQVRPGAAGRGPGSG